MDLNKKNERYKELSLIGISRDEFKFQVKMKKSNEKKVEEIDRYRKRRRAKRLKLLKSDNFQIRMQNKCKIYTSLSHNSLVIFTFIALLNQNVADLYELPKINSENSNSSISGSSNIAPPSQLFLTPISQQQANSISLVNGVKKSDIEEDDGGFIMKTIQPTVQNESASDKDLNTDSVTLPTKEISNDDTTATTATDFTQTTSPQIDTTTLLDQSGSIPIDANRQQFLTHDQLSLLNASTKDENIYLNNYEKDSQEPSGKRVQSPRSGMSKLSHVSSFLSGELCLLSTNNYVNLEWRNAEERAKVEIFD